MPMNDDDILAQELGNAGALGGSRGAGHAGKFGGRIGGIVGAKLLSTQEYEITIPIKATATDVVSTLTDVLMEEGTVLSSEAGRKTAEVKSLTYAGFLNMNPAILIAHIEQTGPDTTSVRFTGKAKEGLIKQHTAEKAARRIIEALLSRLQ
jgi:hypothetical protein